MERENDFGFVDLTQDTENNLIESTEKQTDGFDMGLDFGLGLNF